MKLVLKITLGVALGLVVFVVGCSALVASSSDDIERELDRSAQQVERELDREIAQEERKMENDENAGEREIKQAHAQIELGMSKADVRALLGSPDSSDDYGYGMESWTYESERGYSVLSIDYENGVVSGKSRF